MNVKTRNTLLLILLASAVVIGGLAWWHLSSGQEYKDAALRIAAFGESDRFVGYGPASTPEFKILKSGGRRAVKEICALLDNGLTDKGAGALALALHDLEDPYAAPYLTARLRVTSHDRSKANLLFAVSRFHNFLDSPSIFFESLDASEPSTTREAINAIVRYMAGTPAHRSSEPPLEELIEFLISWWEYNSDRIKYDPSIKKWVVDASK